MAKFSQIISAIDSHTEGHNTRIVLSGMPPIPGNTIAEKFIYIKNSVAHKQLREALMLEPRGHRGMFGVVLTPPCHPEADWGIIFMNDSNFLPGCGHGTIGTATVLAEMGIADKTSGTVKYLNSILAEARGAEAKCRKKLLEAFDKIKILPEATRVVDSYKELEKETLRARRAVEEILVLGLIPGQCRVCRRLGI